MPLKLVLILVEVVNMKQYQDKELLEQLYNKHKSAYKIAEELGVNYKTIYSWLKKFDIKTNDSLQSARKHNCNHDYFNLIDSGTKAYWLGFIMADGCIYKGDSKDSYRLQINLASGDRTVLERFNNSIESDYNIEDKIVNGHEVSTLKINSTKMCKDLMSLGVTPKKSLICSMPNIQFKNDFIRGYFDGDGCITSSNNKWKVSIVGGQPMLETMQNYLREKDIESHIYPVRNNIFDLTISKQSEMYKFHNMIYSFHRVALMRKKEKFQDFINKTGINKCPAEE